MMLLQEVVSVGVVQKLFAESSTDAPQHEEAESNNTNNSNDGDTNASESNN